MNAFTLSLEHKFSKVFSMYITLIGKNPSLKPWGYLEYVETEKRFLKQINKNV